MKTGLAICINHPGRVTRAVPPPQVERVEQLRVGAKIGIFTLFKPYKYELSNSGIVMYVKDDTGKMWQFSYHLTWFRILT